MVPGGQVFDPDDVSGFYKLVANRSEDVRVNALIKWAGVGDFLFQGAHGCYPVLFQDVNDASFSDFPPFVSQNRPLIPLPIIYIYIVVCLAGFWKANKNFAGQTGRYKLLILFAK